MPSGKTEECIGDKNQPLVPELSKIRRFYNFIFHIQALPSPPGKDETIRTSIQRTATITVVQLTAATIASLISYSLSYPLEIVKVHHQLLQAPPRRCPKYSFRCRYKWPMYQSIWDTARSLYLSKGVKRFYKGHGEAQRDNLYQTVSMFWVYQNVRSILNQNASLKDRENLTQFLSGFISAVFIVVVLYPVKTMRNHQNVRNGLLRRHGRIAAAPLLRRPVDWRSHYRGSYSSIAHLGPLYGFQFMIYNYIVDQMVHYKSTVNSRQNLTQTDLLLAGGASGLLANVICHPMDLIRVRMQSSALHRQHYFFEDTCRRYRQCVFTILRREGLYGFYKGILSTLLNNAVNTGLQFAIYDKTWIWLKNLFLG